MTKYGETCIWSLHTWNLKPEYLELEDHNENNKKNKISINGLGSFNELVSAERSNYINGIPNLLVEIYR